LTPKGNAFGTSSHRPEIDGLRALAIFVVVGFHAFPTVVPFGFVGVDVFFVVSGYLISKIILGGLGQGNFTPLGVFTQTSNSCVQDRAKLENDQRPYRASIESLKAADSCVLVYNSLDALCDEHPARLMGFRPDVFYRRARRPEGKCATSFGVLEVVPGLGVWSEQ
jgi:hypothetical protein